LRRHVLANSFKLQTPSSFPGLTSLSIKSGKAQHERMLSVFPPNADIANLARYVRFVPLADSCTAMYDCNARHTRLQRRSPTRFQLGRSHASLRIFRASPKIDPSRPRE